MNIGSGDPSQDVKVASVLLLVDGNLVLLQPSVTETGDLKYDMRIISQDVEYYILMRDQLSFNFSPPVDESVPPSPSAGAALGMTRSTQSLRDSLWLFCGKDLLAWSDVQDVLRGEETPKPLQIPLDFYPLSVILNKGIVLGVEPEMIQRRDISFTILKFAIRVCLFKPRRDILQANRDIFKDSLIPSVLPTKQSPASRHACGFLPLLPLLTSLILPARARSTTTPRSRRRGRQRKPRQQTKHPTRRTQTNAPTGNILPTSLPPNTDIPRHNRPMHPEDRTPILAHALRPPPPTKGSIRASPTIQLSKDSRRLPPRPTGV